MRKLRGPLAVVIVLVAIWQLLFWVVGDSGLSSPADTVKRLSGLMQTQSFWGHVAETGYAFSLALVLSLVSGVALGILLGLNRTTGVVAEPILINLYSLPKVTLYPVVLLCFGLGTSAKVAFGVMHGLIPIAIFTMNAILQMKPVYLRTAGVLRLSPLQTAVSVVLPAVLPEILSGTRLGFSLCLLGVLIGEMFASQRGLGFMVTNAMGLGDMATVLSVAILLSVFAVGANALLMSLDRSTRHH